MQSTSFEGNTAYRCNNSLCLGGISTSYDTGTSFSPNATDWAERPRIRIRRMPTLLTCAQVCRAFLSHVHVGQICWPYGFCTRQTHDVVPHRWEIYMAARTESW